MNLTGGARDADVASVLLTTMRTRRVCRKFTDGAVPRADLRRIIEAGRLASSAGNTRIHRFLVVTDVARIALVRSVAPGMQATPTALIVICTDLEAAAQSQVQVGKDTTVWIDVGTAAMTMMLMAHALGLGSSPATSFSRVGLRTVLELPEIAVPEFILQVGWRGLEPKAVPQIRSGRLTADDITYWEHYGSRGGP
jgi:nitroreductase